MFSSYMLMIETLGIVVPRETQKMDLCRVSSGKGLVSRLLLRPLNFDASSSAPSPALHVTHVRHSTEECIPLYYTFTYIYLFFPDMNFSLLHLVFFLRATFLLAS